jgi:hypothetical protein
VTIGGIKSHSRIASRIEAAVDSLSEPEESHNIMSNVMSNPELHTNLDAKHQSTQRINETLQDIIELQIFNLNITIAHNDLLCVATIASI